MRRINLLFIFLVCFFSSCSCNRNRDIKDANNVKIRASQDPESLNPVTDNNTISLEIINLIYQSLIVIDREKLNFVPQLAESMPGIEKTDTSSVFSFRIRNEAEWNKEKTITGEDVYFSLKLLKCPSLNNEEVGSRYDFIREVRVDTQDKKKFQIVCDPYTTDMDLMAGDFAVLPEHVVDPEGLLREFSLRELTQQYEALGNHSKIQKFAAWFNSDRFTRNKEFLQGSGGYSLEEWKTGQYVRLRKKEDWWGNKLTPANPHITANPERIIYQIIPDDATALLALKKEQIDVYSGIPTTAYNQLAADKSIHQKYELFTPETHDVTFVGFNARLGKFADKNTRQAIAHLFETDQIIKATQGGFAIRTTGFIQPVNTRFYNKDIPPYNFDLMKAEALLKTAGWIKSEEGWRKKINGQWVPLRINLNYRTGFTEFENVALIFQQAAAKIGIPVTIQPMESIMLSRNLKAHNFEMFLRTVTGNPFIFNLKPILHTEGIPEGGSNVSGFGSPQSDQLLEQINQAQTIEAKATLLKQFQQILHEQGNLIFLYSGKDRLAIHKRFTNLKVSSIKPGYDASAFILKAE